MANTWALICILFLTLAGTCVHAQPPGGWEKVEIGNYVPLDFAFSDDQNGILLCTSLPDDYAYAHTIFCFITSDGGKSWNLSSDTTIYYSLAWYEADILQSPVPGTAFSDNLPTEISIINDTVHLYKEGGAKLYLSHAEKMYDKRFGFRFISYYAESCPCTLAVTHDGWQTYTETGGSLANMVVPLDAKLTDSNSIWVTTSDDHNAIDTNLPMTVIHSTDGGVNWETVSPLKALSAWFMVTIGLSYEGYSGDEVYVIGGAKDTTGGKIGYHHDFAYTTDNGASWKLDSSFPGRVYRLSPTLPGHLWCFVGHGFPAWIGELNIPRYFNLDSGRAHQNFFADSLFYSSNDGKTWAVDTTTFIGDTMYEMHWYDPQHGFVAAVRDGIASMYRYDPASSSVPNATITDTVRLSAYPNPAMDYIRIELQGGPENTILSVTDILGREIALGNLGANRSFNLDTRNCAPGVYFIRASATTGSLTSRFVVSH